MDDAFDPDLVSTKKSELFLWTTSMPPAALPGGIECDRLFGVRRALLPLRDDGRNLFRKNMERSVSSGAHQRHKRVFFRKTARARKSARIPGRPDPSASSWPMKAWKGTFLKKVTATSYQKHSAGEMVKFCRCASMDFFHCLDK